MKNLSAIQKAALRFSRYSDLGDCFYIERDDYTAATIRKLTGEGYLHPQRVLSEKLFLTPTGVEARTAIHFTCVTCGKETTVACPTGHTKCPDHCEDHEFEWMSEAGAAQCIHCHAHAPDDFYDESGGLEPGQTEIY